MEMGVRDSAEQRVAEATVETEVEEKEVSAVAAAALLVCRPGAAAETGEGEVTASLHTTCSPTRALHVGGTTRRE